jgi:hypothetical protein
MEHFMHDYYFLFLHGNDTINRVANTEIFKKLTYLFDGRAIPPPPPRPSMNISNDTSTDNTTDPNTQVNNTQPPP